MADYECSICGAKALYDGRCGDGPVLTCGCDKRRRRWIDDGRGGYYTNPSGATPIDSEYAEKDDDGQWDNDRR